MPNKDIIVIGASAGGIEAIKEIIRVLPRDLKASIFTVVHISPDSPGVLAEIFDRAGSLRAYKAVDRMPIEPGRIYVAPPDRHLLVDRGFVRVTAGPKENRFRPAVDPLFRSAAQAYGPRVVGVVLSGGLDDGTAGLQIIKRCGGTAIVQNPEDAEAPSMPRSALTHVKVDHCLPLKEIAPTLVSLANTPAARERGYQMPEEVNIEVRIAMEDNAIEAGVLKLGAPSNFACPECHGVLLEIKDADHIRFRCHTGHAYSLDSLLMEVTERVEESLWTTIRSIEESVLLLRQMATHLSGHGHERAAKLLLKKAQEAQQRSDLVRHAVMSHETLNESKLSQEGELEVL